MTKVIDFNKARWARRVTLDGDRRALPSRDERQRPGLVSIGVVSAELVRRLTEDD